MKMFLLWMGIAILYFVILSGEIYFLGYGGIIQIIEGCQAHPASATGIACGIIRVFFFILTFWLNVILLFMVGAKSEVWWE